MILRGRRTSYIHQDVSRCDDN